MEAVIENKGFIQGWNKTRDDIYQELQARLDRTVLDVLKNYLRENNVEFDASSTKLDDFKENVVAKLPEAQQLRLTKLEKDITKELRDMTKALHDGSQTAFSELIGKLGEFGKSATKMVARGAAMSAAYALNPTLGGAALAGSIAIPAIVKGVKGFKEKQEESRQESLDAFLLKLTAKYDESTKEIHFDIPQNIMNTVAENLKSDGIEINSSNPTQFIRDVAGLEIDKKELAVKTINSLKGSPYDYNKEITDLKTKIKNAGEIMKRDVMSPLSTAAMVGLNVGNSLATWDPDISASVVTSLATGVATGDITAAMGAGAAQLGVSKAAQFLPDALGDVVQNANEIETMAGATGIALGGALVLKVAPTLIKHGFLAAKNFIVSKKQDKDRAKALDTQEKKELGEKIDKSMQHTAQAIQGKSAREIALGIIADTLRGKGIEIDNSIVSKEDLKKYTQSLSKEDKKDVLEVANALEKAEEAKEGDLKKALGGLAKTAYWGGVIALAGLGVYDAFLNPGFIEGLVVRDSQVAQQTQATFKEQLSSAKETLAGVPKKIKNVPKTINEFFTDPKGYVEKRKALMRNTKKMKERTENNKDGLTEGSENKEGVVTGSNNNEKVVSDPNDKDIVTNIQAPTAQELAKQRAEEAAKERAQAVNEFREGLPKDSDIGTQTFMKTLPGKGNDAYLNLSESANDVVLEAFNLKTEEGLTEFLKSFGEDDPIIQQMMKDLHVKSIEEIARDKFVQESINELGGVNYFHNGITLYLPFRRNHFESDITRLINQRGEEILGTVPTQGASDAEIEAFIDSFYKNGVLDEEKQKYFSILQQSNEMYGDHTMRAMRDEFFDKWLRNLRIKENPDGVFETELNAVKQELKNTANGIVDKSIEEHATAVPQMADKVETAKNAQEYIAETEAGFIEGLESKITSDPLKIAGAGAVVGAGVGAANAVKEGLWGKFKKALKNLSPKNLFRKKQEALPEAKVESTSPNSDDSENKKASDTDRREAWKDTGNGQKSPTDSTSIAKKDEKQEEGRTDDDEEVK